MPNQMIGLWLFPMHYSMDGDIAPLPDMLDVLQNYEDSVRHGWEAHASGAVGATGRGIYEHFGLCQLMRLSGALCR